MQVSLGNLSELARFASGLALFVSCDTGPLHLAAASGVPCLGLFTQTDPARYGCLGAQHLNLVVDDRNAIPLDAHWLAETLAREQAPRELQPALSHVHYLNPSPAPLLMAR